MGWAEEHLRVFGAVPRTSTWSWDGSLPGISWQVQVSEVKMYYFKKGGLWNRIIPGISTQVQVSEVKMYYFNKGGLWKRIIPGISCQVQKSEVKKITSKSRIWDRSLFEISWQVQKSGVKINFYIKKGGFVTREYMDSVEITFRY